MTHPDPAQLALQELGRESGAAGAAEAQRRADGGSAAQPMPTLQFTQQDPSKACTAPGLAFRDRVLRQQEDRFRLRRELPGRSQDRRASVGRGAPSGEQDAASLLEKLPALLLADLSVEPAPQGGGGSPRERLLQAGRRGIGRRGAGAAIAPRLCAQERPDQGLLGHGNDALFGQVLRPTQASPAELGHTDEQRLSVRAASQSPHGDQFGKRVADRRWMHDSRAEEKGNEFPWNLWHAQNRGRQ